MIEKRAFLLAKAPKLRELRDLPSHYDEAQQINTLRPQSGSQPLVMDPSFGYTESKTYAAPGDDDPDRESEGCY